MSKSELPSPNERFDTLVDNLGDAPCLSGDDVDGEDELGALHLIIAGLWQQLSKGDKAKFFADADITVLEAKARHWAGEKPGGAQ